MVDFNAALKDLRVVTKRTVDVPNRTVVLDFGECGHFKICSDKWAAEVGDKTRCPACSILRIAAETVEEI